MPRLIGEIFPTRLRGAGMGFSICAIWAGNVFVSQSFPVMNQTTYLNDNFHGAFPLLLQHFENSHQESKTVTH